MWFFFQKNSVYLKDGLYLHAHLFTKEHPRSQDCISTSDDLKMRLEKPILFARADKERFQINSHYLRADNEFLSDKSGFSEKNLHYLQHTLSADNVGFFSEKPTLSERNPYYLIR